MRPIAVPIGVALFDEDRAGFHRAEISGADLGGDVEASSRTNANAFASSAASTGRHANVARGDRVA